MISNFLRGIVPNEEPPKPWKMLWMTLVMG